MEVLRAFAAILLALALCLAITACGGDAYSDDHDAYGGPGVVFHKRSVCASPVGWRPC